MGTEMSEIKQPLMWVCPHCGDSSEVLVRCTVALELPNFVTVDGCVRITGAGKINWDEADPYIVFCSECGGEIEEMEILDNE